jgi:hypothetical protein
LEAPSAFAFVERESLIGDLHSTHASLSFDFSPLAVFSRQNIDLELEALVRDG